MNIEKEINNASKYVDQAIELGFDYGPKILLSLLTLLIGLWVVNVFTRTIGKQMQNRGIEASLCSFVVSFLNVGLKVLLVISVAGMLGIETTSFIAVLGAAGLAVGLALQGSLANFAGSVLILLFKPFKVGDTIEVDGRLGVVKDIQIFATIMTTFDNKTVIIPNGQLAGGTIINLSIEPIKRLDLTFGIGYGDDLKKAKAILQRIIEEDARVLSEPEPLVAVSELGDSSVNFIFRPWVKTEDFWDAKFDMMEKVKLTFDAEGISIPFPQRDVHLYQQNSTSH